MELELTLPVVVWNNDALGTDPRRHARRRHRADRRRGRAIRISSALAAACGAAGVRVHGATALGEAVRAALAAAGPTLIEAVVGDFQPA